MTKTYQFSNQGSSRVPRERNTWKNLLISLIWLSILFLFAYPVLIEAYFNINKDFHQEYINNQCLQLVFLSNIGFLVLSVFDYVIIQDGMRLKPSIATLFIIAFICTFIIYYLACMDIEGKLLNYPILTSVPHLVLWFHGLFLVLLFWIKYLTLSTTNSRTNEIKISLLPSA